MLAQMKLGFTRPRIYLFGSLFVLSACLKANKAEDEGPGSLPPPPVDGGVEQPDPPKNPELRLQINLPGLSLTTLPSQARSLRVHVYSIQNNKRGTEVQDARSFPIEEDGVYVLEQLKQGFYDIALEVLDEQGTLLAQGEMRALLAEPTETIGDFVLRPVGKKPEIEAFSLAVQVNLRQPILAETPEVTKIFAASCQKCHGPSLQLGKKLNLSFPYSTENPDLKAQGQAALLELVAQRARGTDKPMPPKRADRLSDESLQILDAYAALARRIQDSSVKPEDLLGRAEIELSLGDKTSIRSELVRNGATFTLADSLLLDRAKTYSYTLRIFDQQGSVLLEQLGQTLTPAAEGQTVIKVDLTAPAP